MTGSLRLGALLVLLGALAVALLGSAFMVYQTQQAIVVRIGKPIQIISEPGLHFKVPFVDSVINIDKRILDLDSTAQEIIASDQKRLVVDAFARYKITDPLQFYRTVNSIEGANSRLATLVNSAVRRVVGETSSALIIGEGRSALMGRIRDQVNREAAGFGLSVVDVRIRRADLPEANSQAVFERMKTERQREASEIRAQGNEQAQRTRARAERDATVIIADANSTAEKVRGEGDAERNKIFAEAYNHDPDFFSFYRSMQAYENGLKAGDTRLLLSPDSTFFRYFSSPAASPKIQR